MPPPHLQTQAAKADAVADAVCFRRLMNAVLTVAATWLLYGALRHSSLDLGNPAWWGPLSITITIGAATFALWTVTLGDQQAWDDAYHSSSDASETDG